MTNTTFKTAMAVAVAAALTTGVFAQSAPQFEVASVKASAEQGAATGIGLRITGTQVRIVSLSLRDHIALAFRTKPVQVIAPDWVAQERFDISGNLPAGASPDQIPAMMQALLADRFQLKSHIEKRDFPIYALTVAKTGLKIKGTPIDPNAAPTAIEAGGGGNGNGVSLKVGQGGFSLIPNKLEVINLTMEELAQTMSRMTDRTVIDETAVPERFTFTLDLSEEDYRAALIRSAVSNGVVLPAVALRILDTTPPNVLGPYFDKVGLALDARRAPLDVVVVDSVSKTPSEN